LKLLLLLFTFIISLHAFSEEQIATLQKIRDIAKTLPDRHGETYENTLSAICLTESSAGVNIVGDHRKGHALSKASLGAMQIRVKTARYIAKKTPSLKWLLKYSDAHIANMLLSNLDLSAQIAAHYIIILKHSRNDYMKVVSGYNGGLINFTYYNRVMKNMRLVRSLVKKGRLT